MKMVKSLLLGTAAGLVAMTGAQAADLPVKAKPVQYVKICSLYGAGFYYVPGTDTCLKIGGWVRAQTGYGYNGDQRPMAPLRPRSTSDRIPQLVRRRTTSTIASAATSPPMRARQTEYGTLRSYIAVGTLTDDAGGNTFNSNRAFIQLAGFTVGLAQSFYDFASMAAVSYNGGSINNTGDTGDRWSTVVWGYTAQFGNGFSATIAAEASPRSRASHRGIGGTITVSRRQRGRSTRTSSPTFASIRPWGSAQIMGALHDVSGSTTPRAPAQRPSRATSMGYAVGAGFA